MDREHEEPDRHVAAIRALDRQRSCVDVCDLVPGYQWRPTEARCLVDDMPVRVEHLREVVSGGDEGVRGCLTQARIRLRNERGDVCGASAQGLVDRVIE